MTQDILNQIIQKNKDLKNEGRMEGAAMAMMGGLFYLIVIAAVMKLLNL